MHTCIAYYSSRRKHRRILQLALTPQAVHEYNPLLESEIRQLLRKIARQSTDSDFFKARTAEFIELHID